MALGSINLRTYLLLVIIVAILILLSNHLLLDNVALNSVTTENNNFHRLIPSNNDVKSDDETAANNNNNNNNKTYPYKRNNTNTNVYVMKNKKFLLGIFSTISEASRKRRQLIRDTYLKVSKLGSNPWVCSLDRYQHLIRDLGDIQKADDCIIIYAFIVGTASPDQPEDHYKTSRPITYIPENNREIGTVYLNIKENYDEGKSYTYFKYAYQISSEIKIDYVAKTEDDTFLSMPEFYRYFITPLPNAPYNKRYYGGAPLDFRLCGRYEFCKAISPYGYFAGHFYFMSTDMAGVVSDESIERYSIDKTKMLEDSNFIRDYDVDDNSPLMGTEDLSIGHQIFQWSSQSKMAINQYASTTEDGGGFFHPIVEDKRWLKMWEDLKKRHNDYYLLPALFW